MPVVGCSCCAVTAGFACDTAVAICCASAGAPAGAASTIIGSGATQIILVRLCPKRFGTGLSWILIEDAGGLSTTLLSSPGAVSRNGDSGPSGWESNSISSTSLIPPSSSVGARRMRSRSLSPRWGEAIDCMSVCCTCVS